MCYPAILYSSDRKSATVDVRCRAHSSITNIEYNFGGLGFQSDNEFLVDSSDLSGEDPLSIVVHATDNSGKVF